MKDNVDNFIGALIGGALGDALGYPVEFMTLNEILLEYSSSGICDLKIDKERKQALISDDTQMTLFTADGILWGNYYKNIDDIVQRGIYPSYKRWYFTQTLSKDCRPFLEHQLYEDDDRILNHKELFFLRSPGITCLNSLGSKKIGSVNSYLNNSKGNGGLMRVAPIGLFFHHYPELAFKIAIDSAAITHSHPTGYLAAGVFACIISEIINGKNIENSIDSSLEILKNYPFNEEVISAVLKAFNLSKSNEDHITAINSIGGGWVAEEALAIAIYCALKESDFKKSLVLSVNHSGDSDSTGSICGSIVGANLGVNMLPKEWIKNLELKDFITRMAEKLFIHHHNIITN